MFKSSMLFGITILFLITGCVTKVVESDDPRPTLSTSQNSDGVSFLSWESDTDYFYTIKYVSKPGEPWKVLPGAERIRGTGRTMMIMDKIHLNAKPRRYWISVDKVGF